VSAKSDPTGENLATTFYPFGFVCRSTHRKKGILKVTLFQIKRLMFPKDIAFLRELCTLRRKVALKSTRFNPSRKQTFAHLNSIVILIN